MNYLVHLYLAEPTTDSRLGALMGDFVKGALPETMPLALREGLLRHRRIDAFTQHSVDFIRSKRRLDDRFGLCKAILVDIFYDHFMARLWAEFCATPLEEFAAEVYRMLRVHDADLPEGLRQVAHRMISHNWLVSYREIETVGSVLERISQRLRRPTPLADGLAELRNHYRALEGDFRSFIPQAQLFLR